MGTPSLSTGSIRGHIRNIAMPMSIGFFFNTMYNVVDSIYAGKVSTTALASLALSFPVFFIIIATSEGIARGASALIANAIGAQNKAEESALSTQVFSLGIVCSCAITVIGLLAAPALFQKLGARGESLQIATSYISPLFIGSTFFLLSSLSNSVLLANGDSKTFGIVLIAGFFLNLLLDPWFLYGGLGLPALGVAGIAWATIVIQALGGVFLFSCTLRRGYVRFKGLPDLLPKLKIYVTILKQGIPTAFNMMSIALGFFVTTYFLNNYYTEAATAAFGIGTRIEQIALLPAIGLGAAIVSIVGQNNGAGRLDRVRECVHVCVRFGFGIIAIASGLMFFFAQPLVRIFTDNDPEVISIGVKYVRIMSLIQWAYVMTFIHIGFLQALKRPMYGFIESMVRKIILPIGVFAFVVLSMKISLENFWWTMAIINVVMTMITIGYAQTVLRSICAPGA